ncbi:methylase involved in ubiquinone/menaquinone biosynthesis [Rhizobium sp. CF122]|uniref:class I SAM-dependent methyltransferase n=1 Tax=Rhizobium sp. CF122 TaxID=1144312 RepID=UPI0002718604|nr:class I SAM-dependent methyltransferase [Rhizobium sp. CF122]EJL58071.1 methylase involved in ubiquinone/menaquinone biosynthesis [Rhizobium sp. CF122]
MSNQNNSEFDAYRTTYADTVNQAISFSGLKLDFFTKAKAVRLVSLLREKVGNPMSLSILDVGCGVGSYHPLLKDSVGKITGIDPSSECIEEGRKNNPNVDYVDYDGTAMPFGDGTFDASFAICVMHHVPPQQWNEFSREMVRVTRKGGLVVIFEHNPYNPLTKWIVSNCPFDENAVLLTKRQTASILGDAGLKNIEGRYILTVPAIDGVARVVDDMFGSLPFGAQYYVAGRP